MNQQPIALILAAGKGTRFKSKTIKILHPLLGQPMIFYVLDTVKKLGTNDILVVVGYQKEKVMSALKEREVQFVIQDQQLGTAHAVMAAQAALRPFLERDLLVVNGDLPLLRPESLQPLLEFHQRERNALTFVTALMDNPFGFGRVIEVSKGKYRVVEEREASPEQKKIKEANVGLYLFRIKDLFGALPKVSNNNSKQEFYLTDLIEILSQQGKKVRPFSLPAKDEIVGVNDRYELAQALRVLQIRKNRSLAQLGVTIIDPETTWIDIGVEVGEETIIYPGVVIEGKSKVGKDCRLESFAVIRDSILKDDVHVLASSVVEGSILESQTKVGPFTHLRAGSHLRKGAKVGNFVEMKKTEFGPESKAMHLSYLGDSKIGRQVNIGAGTITCNYDGLKKHETQIEDEVFIGSGTQLVAPVKIGRGAYVGAGSTITKNVSPEALAVARGRQVEKLGWARRKRKKR